MFLANSFFKPIAQASFGALLLMIAALGLAAAPPAAAEPAEVKVGAYINDIQQLDLQNHSYNVDLYIWFKWTDPEIDPAFTLEFMNSFELWGHILTYESEEPIQLEDGSFYMALRNQGKFNTKLPLEKYPFDNQALSVEFESSAHDASELRFVPDDAPIAANPDMTLPGYVLGSPRLSVVDKLYASGFGVAPSDQPPAYSRVTVEMPVSRPTTTYAIKLLLPMLLVVLSASLMFMVHPTYVEGRIGIGITALLTLVALQITSNDKLPDLDYLMLLDKIFIASYAFVVAGLAVVVRSSWADAENHLLRAVRTDRLGLGVLSGAYMAVVAVILLTTLL